MNYKNTLNLPKTDFSMKANLLEKEPKLLKEWGAAGMYGAIRKARKGRKKFILHDGPPYANGRIHMGHVLNKILKDIVVKYNTMRGHDSPYVPGWDCHGLPVEHQLFKELGISKHDIDQVKFRKKAAGYAMKFVEIQKKEFERLGIFGKWEKPYLTLNPEYEAAVIRSFGELVKKGYVYRDLKPVNWCTTCETALAEAEVEYEERKSPSIYVKFRVTGAPASRRPGGDKNLRGAWDAGRGMYFIIWTTTPWTLLGNAAIAVHPDRDYAILEAGAEEWVVLEALAGAVTEKLGKPLKIKEKIKGKDLEGTVCRHPFIERDSKVVSASYVSSEEGTGCVHTAPGHGQEDYITGRKYNLPMIMPVSSKGVFDRTCGEFSGMHVREATPKILERLKSGKNLLLAEEIAHSYPHCWRCKKPIITRATEQYFVKIDHKNLREKMLGIIEKDVGWFPASGKGRISAMVRNRPDWCLSRQRYWGVPIVAFRCKSCGEILLDPGVIEHVAGITEKEGTDSWFIKSEKELLPEGAMCVKCKCAEFIKERDILDVWFESGVSYEPVLRKDKKMDFPCGLYLEGSDQHRGWFQSSLITSSAINGEAPYRSVLTHGFVVDGEGKKMSKSAGNVISPREVMERYGADILRLWVASSDYHDDVRLSEEILRRLADAYRKIRNTFRYLLGNIGDFDFGRDAVRPDEMLEIDRWMLSRLAGLIEEAEKNYSEYNFYKIFRAVYNFCVYEISSLYLDILKDRLYTFSIDSPRRRSAQTVLYEILSALLKIMAPVLVFTTEEAWRSFGAGDKRSVHLSEWQWDRALLKKWRDGALEEKWARLLDIRGEVMKVIEAKRGEGVIGGSLEAEVVLYSDNEDLLRLLEDNRENLTSLFITSKAEISTKPPEAGTKAEAMPVWILVKRAEGKKCSRCWNRSRTVGSVKGLEDICARCADVIKPGLPKKKV